MRSLRRTDIAVKAKAPGPDIFRSNEVAADKLASLTVERDDLKVLLSATLARLESVDGLVHRADISTSLMEEKVRASCLVYDCTHFNHICLVQCPISRCSLRTSCEPESSQ